MDELAREVLALSAQGHGPREIERRLQGTPLACSRSTASRILREHKVGTPPPRRTTGPRTVVATPLALGEEGEEEEEVHPLDPAELAERDPVRLRERDWLWYEGQVLELRRLAAGALKRNDANGYKHFFAAARAAQTEADALRPPAPPDPEKDPTYRNEARRLVTYLENVITEAERGAPIPPRSLPPTEPVAPSA